MTLPGSAQQRNPSKQRAGYVDAIGTCAARNWGVGDLLVSARWKGPMQIKLLRPSYNCVTLITANGAAKRNREFERLPADVEKVA